MEKKTIPPLFFCESRNRLLFYWLSPALQQQAKGVMKSVKGRGIHFCVPGLESLIRMSWVKHENERTETTETQGGSDVHSKKVQTFAFQWESSCCLRAHMLGRSVSASW